MNKNATTELIAELYDEGDIDYLFLGYVYSHVKYDRFNNPRSNDAKRLAVAALKIMRFLIEDGDFSFLKANVDTEGKVTHSPIEFNFEQLESMLVCENKMAEIEYVYIFQKNKIGKAPTDEYPDILGELAIEFPELGSPIDRDDPANPTPTNQ